MEPDKGLPFMGIDPDGNYALAQLDHDGYIAVSPDIITRIKSIEAMTVQILRILEKR